MTLIIEPTNPEVLFSHGRTTLFSHIEEARKWESALKANAYKNHQEEKMQALLNVNLERNIKKLWRP